MLPPIVSVLASSPAERVRPPPCSAWPCAGGRRHSIKTLCSHLAFCDRPLAIDAVQKIEKQASRWRRYLAAHLLEQDAALRPGEAVADQILHAAQDLPGRAGPRSRVSALAA
jgi:hypothetical protein